MSTKLLGQFVDCLETTVLGPGNDTAQGAPSAGDASAAPATEPSSVSSTANAAPATDAGVRRVAQPEAQPIALLDAAGAPLAKRLIPVGVVILVILALLLRRRRRSD